MNDINCVLRAFPEWFSLFSVKAHVERDAIHIRVRTAFRSLEAIEYSRDKPNVSSSYSPTLAPHVGTFKEIILNEWNGRCLKWNYRPKVMKCWPSDNHRSKNPVKKLRNYTKHYPPENCFQFFKWKNSLTSRERREVPSINIPFKWMKIVRYLIQRQLILFDLRLWISSGPLCFLGCSGILEDSPRFPEILFEWITWIEMIWILKEMTSLDSLKSPHQTKWRVLFLLFFLWRSVSTK